MKVRIKVKKTDIKNAKFGQGGSVCPVALALKRVFDVGEGVWVSNNINGDKNYLRLGNRKFNQPKSVESFVQQYDSGQAVTPFEFVLEV